MLSSLIASADSGKVLWMPDLRKLFAQDASSSLCRFHLHLITGEWLEREYHLPHWKNLREKKFLQEYFYACVYNLLSVYSGQELSFEYAPADAQITELVGSLDSVFQLRETERYGYGKALNTANRLCHAFGLGSFAFSVFDGRYQKPSAVPPCEGVSSLPHRTVSGAVCGIDIGGSDIKFALALDGMLKAVTEYDWNPGLSPTAEGILGPVLEQVKALRARLPGTPLLDAIGVSFPDIVIDNRILGGETPKTDGMRKNKALNYEQEFSKLSRLGEYLKCQCKPGAAVRIINDGNMAAFTAANELSEEELIAHTLGTDLGTGWVLPGGLIPKIPLELYDIILDLGSYPSRRFLPEDLRSTRNENSSLPGARRYLGQAAAYRLAWELDPALLKGYFHGDASSDRPILIPGEQRKACLSHLMDCAESGNQLAEELFRRIGLNFGVMSCEMDFLLHPPTKDRYLYGRFVKSRRCFELLQEGCRAYSSEFTIYAPDEETANTPLMKQLAERPDVSVAQFGQAIGAIYFAASSA